MELQQSFEFIFWKAIQNTQWTNFFLPFMQRFADKTTKFVNFFEMRQYLHNITFKENKFQNAYWKLTQLTNTYLPKEKIIINAYNDSSKFSNITSEGTIKRTSQRK